MSASSSQTLPLSLPISLLATPSGAFSATKTSTSSLVPLPGIDFSFSNFQIVSQGFKIEEFLIINVGSANAIHHLASVEHVKNLKHFFWKNGGAMDQLDKYMFSDDDLDKVLYMLSFKEIIKIS